MSPIQNEICVFCGKNGIQCNCPTFQPSIPANVNRIIKEFQEYFIDNTNGETRRRFVAMCQRLLDSKLGDTRDTSNKSFILKLEDTLTLRDFLYRVGYISPEYDEEILNLSRRLDEYHKNRGIR